MPRRYGSHLEVEPTRRVLALGTFDGVHIGHQRVMQLAVEHARLRGAVSCAGTFHPRPVSVLVPGRAPEALATLERRSELIAASGVEEIAVIRFDRELAALSADAFVQDVLLARFGVVEVVVGENYRFGKGRSGDPNVLRAIGEEHEFGVTVVPLLEVDGDPVSSSRIRELIGHGEVERAAQLLGRPPELEGVVVHGDGRGRTLGIPTANVELVEGFAHPGEGVYAGDVVLDDGRRLRAAISVGSNPTFDGARAIRVEAHVLRLDEDLYGRPLRVEFRRFLRGQVKYDSVDALLAQIAEDIRETDR